MSPVALRFGTAGLRAPMGPGPDQMNVGTVRQVAAGIASWCWAEHRGAPAPLVVVGHDARHGSVDFAGALVEVLTQRGCDVARFDGAVPTPLGTFAVTELDAAAAVIVTASHNPAGDNGLKVVGADGAQVGPPHDAAIEAWTHRPDPTPRPPGQVRPLPVAGDLAARFVARALRLAGTMEHPPRVVYTAMHGVGAMLLEDVLASAGLPSIRAVESQRRPDPDFPSVERPNPEEPAALERLLAAARRGDAELALALDPDADRLAVAVPVPGSDPSTPWRVLTGDEVGALLTSFLLGRGTGADRLVCSTIVSSQLVGRICAARGVHHVETPTGFKWLARPGLDRPDLTQVLCYEEAIGYAVGADAHDKDAVTAAAVVCALVSELSGLGRSVLDELDALARTHGAFVTCNGAVALTDTMASIDELARRWDRSDAPARRSPDRPAPGVLRWRLDDGTRILCRRSGTEPRMKYYCESAETVTADGVAAARRRAARRADGAVAILLGLLSDPEGSRP